MRVRFGVDFDRRLWRVVSYKSRTREIRVRRFGPFWLRVDTRKEH